MSDHTNDPRRIVVTRALMRVMDEHPSKDPTFGQMSDAVLDALDAHAADHCSQCGHAYSDRACGPTHAIVANERRP